MQIRVLLLLCLSFLLTLTLTDSEGNFSSAEGAHSHVEGAPIVEYTVEPTCTEDGKEENVVYCLTCNVELWRYTDILRAEGHSLADEVIENEVSVTCTTDGSYDSVIYCSVCNFEESREAHIINSEGHKPLAPIKENEISPSCLDEGRFDSVVYCDVCKDELSRESNTVEPLGHLADEGIVSDRVEPICKKDGSCSMTRFCSRCKIELSKTTEVIPAVGHIWSDGKCKDCGIEYSVAESLQTKLSDDGTYYIIAGIGTFSDSVLTIPSEYKGLPVKEIADHAFKDCTFVVEAFIPESVTRLGYGAAEGCTGLEKLVLESRNGWSLYDGQEEPKIFPIPSFMLIDTTYYFDLLINSDQFALVKK